MKKNKWINIIVTAAVLFSTSGCMDSFSDIKSNNKILPKDVWNDPAAITGILANMYNSMIIEDFSYFYGDYSWRSMDLSAMSDECTAGFQKEPAFDQYNAVFEYPDEFLGNYIYIQGDQGGEGNVRSVYPESYRLIRNCNDFLEKIIDAPMNEDEKKTTIGEVKFLRAWVYFTLVKRYGGVPILREPQEYVGDIESLKVPRDTEKACYDFIAEDLDEAFRLLPDNEEILGKGRATKYAALALKSRAMLYAGSIARYGTVDLNGLVGIDKALANDYFELAYKAVKELEKSKRFSLYRKNSDKEKNFAELFLAEDSPENIFCKYFQRNVNAHGWDVYFVPYQYRGNGFSSNMNPTLEFVEMFEHKDGTPANFAERAKNTYFDDPSELFQNMDARFGGSIIYPNAIFKGEPCSIQKGLIIEDGSKKENATNYEEAVYTANDGQVYHIVGKSGSGNYSGNMTGFFMRKYLNENMPQSEVIENYSEQHWIEFRYAEALLNGAEAAVEMGQHLDDALLWINDIRSRADIKQLSLSDLTVDKVRHERRIELAFENHTYWDLRRWRIADKEIETKQYTGLCPYFDINKQKYIFEEVAANKYYYTFDVKMYYERIPDGEIAKNEKLKQNPYYN